MDEIKIPDVLRSDEVTGYAQVTYRQLDNWVGLGVITPSIDEGRGQGNRRRWSRFDLTIVKALARLARLGCPTSMMAIVVDQMRLRGEVLLDGYDWMLVEPVRQQVTFGAWPPPLDAPAAAWYVGL